MTGLRALVEAVREADLAFAAESAACKKREPSRSRCECDRLRQLASMRIIEVGEYVTAHPDVLAAVEAVVALGEAKALERAEWDALPDIDLAYMSDEQKRAWDAAAARLDDAHDTVFELADRLAARKGE